MLHPPAMLVTGGAPLVSPETSKVSDVHGRGRGRTRPCPGRQRLSRLLERPVLNSGSPKPIPHKDARHPRIYGSGPGPEEDRFGYSRQGRTGVGSGVDGETDPPRSPKSNGGRGGSEESDLDPCRCLRISRSSPEGMDAESVYRFASRATIRHPRCIQWSLRHGMHNAEGAQHVWISTGARDPSCF